MCYAEGTQDRQSDECMEHSRLNRRNARDSQCVCGLVTDNATSPTTTITTTTVHVTPGGISLLRLRP
ncbi:hypothetical protein E2C01_078401 [Portunus trituberculatus]|uniref:Uncharacterized protein n=1 Tax=Portunus trituberculatus TaxID=210409 RepID=A0A5B7IQ13_PORTR|nr:hypothetical protein [Portunus trituberculatus]